MAERNEDLIFGMKLDVDPGKFGQQWPKIEADLQAIIDKHPLKVSLSIDEAKIKSALSELKKYGLSDSVASKDQTAAYNAITKRIQAETAQRNSIKKTSEAESDLIISFALKT